MRLQEFFEDNDGSLSATRLAFLLWALGVLTVWIVASLRGSQLVEINSSIQIILGILMTGKVVQKFGEKEPPETATAKGSQPHVADPGA